MNEQEVNRQEVEEDWNAQGYSCDLWVDPPGQRWEGYVHSSDELLMVVEGRLELEIAGKVFHPVHGEEVYIPRGAIHSVRNIGDTTARWLYGYN